MQVAMKRTDSSNAMSSCLALRYYALLFIHYPTDREYSNVFPIAFCSLHIKASSRGMDSKYRSFFLSLSRYNRITCYSHIFKTQSHQLIFDNKLGQRWETTGRLRSKIKYRFRIILSAKWYAALNHPDVIRRKYILSSMYDL